MDLPDDGRSSIESTLSGRIGLALDAFGSVSPVIDFQMLACLKYLSIFNPDVSQYIANTVNLGNTGHQITVDAPTPELAEQALIRINESAARLYLNGAGVDGLVNAYIRQIAWSGALSSEDVVDPALAAIISQAQPDQLEQLITMYADKAAERFPATCQSCGSKQVSGRSSVEDAESVETAGGVRSQQTPAVAPNGIF